MRNIEELDKQLGHKHKNINDLIRYIDTRTDDNPNYTLLLGAGCSVTSGISSGQMLIEQWKKEMFLRLSGTSEDSYDRQKATEYLIKEQGSWYNPAREYSSLFEKMYDQPRQRRVFIEKTVQNAFPSLGYAYLLKLIEERYFNTIFTTNFDDLINEAFYQFSDTRPIICAHDSSINSITVTSKRPKIIKLHGDYLFDDIKTTLKETESLEQNIRNKFIEFCKEYGLIVLGYGGNDRSVMDVIYYLLKSEEYLKHGIYWCLRKDDYVNDELRKLLWNDGVYYVEIDGFDEFFAELHNSILTTKPPVDSNLFRNKMSNYLNSFIKNDFLQESKCEIIQKHLKNYNREQNSNYYFDALQTLHTLDMDNDEDSASNLIDSEIIFLIDLEKEIKIGHYEEALKLAKNKLSEKIKKDFEIQILLKTLQIHEDRGENDSAINVCNKLISLESKDARIELLKTNYIDDLDQELEIINEAIRKDKYNYRAYNSRARVLSKLREYTNEETVELREQIISTLDKSIDYNPLITNPAFLRKLRFLISESKKGEDSRSEIVELIEHAKKQNEYSWVVSRMILEYCDNFDEKDYNGTSLKEIVAQNRNENYPNSQINHLLVQIDTLAYLDDNVELKGLMDSEDFKKSINNPDIILKQVEVTFNKYKDLHKAIDILENTRDIKSDKRILSELFDLYILDDQIEKAQLLLADIKKKFDKESYITKETELLEAKGDYLGAIASFESLKDYDKYFKYKHTLQISYLYLRAKSWEEARSYSKKFLDDVNFDTRFQAEILNYEFASHKLGKSVDKKRIEKISTSPRTKDIEAICHLLNGDKKAAMKIFEKQIKRDYSNLFSYLKWPILEEIHKQLEPLK